jgi:probable rRNA maturation factor
MVDVARWRRLGEGVLAAEGVRGNVELSVLFVEEDDIAALNEQFLGHQGPTDVLAFPIDAVDVDVMSSPTSGHSGPDRPPPDPSDQPLLLGDVVLCPTVAERQAAEHAGSYDDEIALLVVHGILHVLGHDHPSRARRRYAPRERELAGVAPLARRRPDGFRRSNGCWRRTRPPTSGSCSPSSC